MELKRIGPVSAAKVLGLCYAGFGLLQGALFSVLSLLGATAAMTSEGESGGAAFAVLFGAGAIIILPLFAGFFGGIAGLILALIYNLIAGLVGGLELEFAKKNG